MSKRKAFFFCDIDDQPSYAPNELAMWNALIPRLNLTEIRMRNRALSDPAQSMVGMSATQKKAELLAGLSWLTNGAQPGDTLFFFLLTHGGLSTDGTNVDETDRFDETMYVSSIVNGVESTSSIRDDDLRAEILKARTSLAGVAFYAYSSACNSGTFLDLPHHFATATDANNVDSLVPYDEAVPIPAKFPVGSEVMSIGSSQDAYLTRAYPLWPSHTDTPAVDIEVAPGVIVPLEWMDLEWGRPCPVNPQLVALLRAIVKGTITSTTTHQGFMNAYMNEMQAFSRETYWYDPSMAAHPIADPSQYNANTAPPSPENNNPVFGLCSLSMLQTPCRIVASQPNIIVARNAITKMTLVSTSPAAYSMAPSSTSRSIFFTPTNTYGRDVYVVYKARAHSSYMTTSKFTWQFEIRNDGAGLSSNAAAISTSTTTGIWETQATQVNTKYSVVAPSVSGNAVYTIKALLPPGHYMTSAVLGSYTSRLYIDPPIFVYPEHLSFV
jgi:hypothetical protein